MTPDRGDVPAADGWPAASVSVRVPATSANLGPGYDSFGLALAVYDRVSVEVCDDPLVLDVCGQGADTVGDGEANLVVRALRAGLDSWAGSHPPGLRMRCDNAIPHGRGLGSSAAAIVAGLSAARALLPEPTAVDDDQVLELANRLEGHPDNVAACLFGGFTVCWEEPAGVSGDVGPVVRALRLQPDPRVRVAVFVPASPMSTVAARSLIPEDVPHPDAVFTAARAGLLVAALTGHPELLLPATEDRLHQPYRGGAMAGTAALVRALRSAGIAAMVSGAGPSVLALTDGAAPEEELRRLAGPDWHLLTPDIDLTGAHTDSPAVAGAIP